MAADKQWGTDLDASEEQLTGEAPADWDPHPVFDLLSDLERHLTSAARGSMTVTLGHHLRRGWGASCWTATARDALGSEIEKGTGPTLADALIALAQNLDAQRKAG